MSALAPERGPARAPGCGRDAGRSGRVRDAGTTTAELAVAMPALTLLLTAAIASVAAVQVKVQCLAAAREAALTSARGGPGVAAGNAVAPPGAQVQVVVSHGLARATVRSAMRPFGIRLPAVAVTADATAALEPGCAS